MLVDHGSIYSILTTLQLFGLTIYRVTLHPLAKYPGPFLAKITTLYDTYHSYAKDRHIDQYECQKKYGNVFRYGPNNLIINTPGGLKDISQMPRPILSRKAHFTNFSTTMATFQHILLSTRMSMLSSEEFSTMPSPNQRFGISSRR